MAVFDALYLRDTNRLPAGRIAWVARSIMKRLRAGERPALGRVVDEAVAAGQRAYDLHMSRQRARGGGLYSPGAQAKNTALDNVTSGIFNQLDLLARIHPVGTELGDAVRRLSRAFYPHTLLSMTNSSFPEELEAARRTLRLARGERAADVAAVPGLDSLLGLLEERADVFESVLDREKPTGPSFEEAAAAAEAAERRICDVVNAIQVLYQGDSPEAEARRAELLEPYALQQEAMRRRYRRRQRPVDVDPETGEELADATERSTEAEPA